ETIFGTYVHGLFDDAGFRRYFINLIRKRKGLSPLHSLTLSWQETVDQELDRLADIIEEYVDVKKIEEEVMKGEREC
ncbi:MAG: cobyric acid synthase CobQ, partial [Candidatus Atribacteria bacterium]|nr:cobyric acid synthase CobQ [Candidatus Atribacteria bacterium]